MSNNCVIIASHQRYEVTAKFIESLSRANIKSKICKYLLILDTSTSKTNQSFIEKNFSFKLIYFYLGPSFWWCSAMRFGITWFLNFIDNDSRIILANDDFLINEESLLEFSINQNKARKNDILVGAIKSESPNSNKLVSGIRIVEYGFFKPRFKLLAPEDFSKLKYTNYRITFNSNWLSISTSLYKALGGLYNYSHAYGDYELGLKACNYGANIYYGCEKVIGDSLITQKSDDAFRMQHKKLKLGRNIPFERAIFIKRNFNLWYLNCYLIRDIMGL